MKTIGVAHWHEPHLRALPRGVRLVFAFLLLATTGAFSVQDSRDAPRELPTELDADRKPATKTGGACLLRNFNILTATGQDLMGGDVLIEKGKIGKIGKGLTAPAGVTVIEGNGRYLMPGIIDCHSHMAIDRGINEGTNPLTPEVSIREVVRNEDVALYRALAGGVTCAHLLHGSANVIGGQDAVVKLKYGKSAEEMLFPDAPRGIKFALGENPKQSNFDAATPRFPATRQGVESVLRRAFTEAKSYQSAWDTYEAAVAKGETPIPPRRDLRLETLSDIMRGHIRVHSHGYRADELLMLLRVAEDFGWKVSTFQHGLEAYKIAPEIARHGAMVSTFSDWWAYKFEAFDAIPYNCAILTRAGVVASINSDSSELVRRLNLEAAKSLKYGNLSDSEALRLCTLNPAIQLGIAHRVGSIEVGKDADLAVFSGHPLSVYSSCEMTLIDGEVFFERRSVFAAAKNSQDSTSRSVAPPARLPARPERSRGASPLPIEGAETDQRLTVIAGATLHPITGPDIEKGTIVVRGRNIVRILREGEKMDLPGNAVRLDARGLHVYPGLIDCGSEVGLAEVDSVAGTVDTRELGTLQPDLMIATAVNPDSDHIPVTRVNGVTSTLIRPGRGGRIPGRASVMHLSGVTREEMALQHPAALIVNYPTLSAGGGFGGFFAPAETEEVSPAIREAAARELDRLRDLFQRAREYDARKQAGARENDPRLEAMLPYVRNERPVIINASTHAQMVGAIKLIDELKVTGIIAQAREGWKVADELARKQIPVIVGSVFELPPNPYDPYDCVYANAAQLVRAGVRIAFQSNDSSNARNLPYQAGMAVAYGLPRETALRALTIQAAELLGVERQIGSLEPGKRADLVVTDGDILEIRTAIKHVFIDGRPVPLETRHTKLYERYRGRAGATSR